MRLIHHDALHCVSIGTQSKHVQPFTVSNNHFHPKDLSGGGGGGGGLWVEVLM